MQSPDVNAIESKQDSESKATFMWHELTGASATELGKNFLKRIYFTFAERLLQVYSTVKSDIFVDDPMISLM